MEKISVIIPAYNAEAFIAETVRSALSQTYPDVEVIVVDDGSTDDTLGSLNEFADRIRVHRQSNAGVSKARNAGVGIATGSWIAFLDADDLWAPTKLAQQSAYSDIPMCFTDRYNIGARGDVPELQSDSTPMQGGDLFEPLLVRGNFITLSTVLLRRTLFDEMQGFYSGLHGTEDWDLWLRIAERHPIAFCPEPLVSYRFHPGGLSRNHRQMAQERIKVIARALSSDRGRQLPWRTRQRIWSETLRTNAADANRAGARAEAIRGFVKAVAAWPLWTQPYKEAIKACLNA